MILKNDRDGLESLPLKMMIVALVASLSIIPASGALDNLRNRDFVNRVELQLETMTATAQTLAASGPGGARTIDFDFRNEGSLAFESIVIGDGDGANRSSAVLRFTNGATMVRTCADPEPWMRTIEGHGLLVKSPVFAVRLSAHIEGMTEYILLEAV